MRNNIKTLITCLSLLFSLSIFAQEESKSIISGILLDNEGIPVSEAIISAEGSKSGISDADGNFSIEILSGVSIVIESEECETLIVNNPLGMNGQTFNLKKLPYQMREKDLVNLPFGTLHKRQISGAVTTLDPSDILSYDARQGVLEAVRGRVPGVMGSSNIHGIGGATVIVDGIPRQDINLFNLNDVEQITVLKDASSRMLYGVQADKGIILITTKKGEAFKKVMNFKFETGIEQPISYPGFMNSADYMTYHNEALANDTLYGNISIDQYNNHFYSQDVIDSSRANVNKYKYPNEDYYSSDYLSSYTKRFSFFGETSGGNENVSYYSNFGWRRNSSLLNLGNGSEQKSDVFNIRGNVNYKVNDMIQMDMSALVIYDIDNRPNYTGPDYWDIASTYHPNYFPLLIPSNLVKDSSLLDAATFVNGNNLLGGTNQFRSNIYGDLFLGGVSSTTNRTLQVKPGLDFDLNKITEGLKAKVYMALDMNNVIQTYQDNTYSIYQPNFVQDSMGNESLEVTKYGIDEKKDNKTVGDASMYSRYTYYGSINYDRTFSDHQISAVAMTYYDNLTLTGVYYPQKNLHFGIRANYLYKNKYSAEFTGVYAGSSKISEDALFSFSPGVSLGWILSEESFLSGNSFLNFLKARASWGRINTDESVSDYYLYKTITGTSSNYYYGNGTSYNRSVRFSSLGNSNLMFPQRNEMTFGLDALLAGGIWFETTYYISSSDENLIKRTEYYPMILGGIYPYDNYNSFQNQGLELGLKISNKIGNLEYKVGATLLTVSQMVKQIDEPNYEDDYLKQEGQISDARFGLEFDRFYTESDFDTNGDLLAGEAIPVFGKVSPGDLKYRNLNEDGYIDNNDRKIIGGSAPDEQLALEIQLKYKNFELFALGSAQFGATSYTSGDYYWVDGDDKYSDVIKERWTPGSGQDASYPKLTTLSNSNNFRNSTFWLYDTDAFTLHALQLSYNIQAQNLSWVKSAQVYLRGNNLLTIAKEKEKLLLNTTSGPQMRGIFTIGLNASF
ncbi:MAG: SusC/RagA family TonB-linked outer membrane protein [Bacteroidales bacterium]|nr:SusC/RagA family TonB-linked outer membrane protein [Bacteroidales bacterium]MCF8390441.1 SusC/RagA family TonB-linked outer membrane protein [Bacteroidales bacterium]